jgi:hypothetical protein
MTSPPSSECFRVDDRLTILPVVHASGPYARAVEKWLLEHPIDCLAVPLPPSFGEPICRAIPLLPNPSMVIQPPMEWSASDDESTWDSDIDSEEDISNGFGFNDPGHASEEESQVPYSYVPIDPSQSVIAALRFALGEHLPIRFIDLEVAEFYEERCASPDAFALRSVSIEAFATSVLPAVGHPTHPQVWERIHFMAEQLRGLTRKYKNVVALCSIQHWPWLRQSYLQPNETIPDPHSVHEAELKSVAENTLVFLFGELPYITGVYEESRRDSAVDNQLPAIDGIKRLLITARASYIADLGPRGRRITTLLLSQCLKYIRNLTLLDRRLTPDLYTLAIAAKQILGDQFAIHLVEAARNYPFIDELPWPTVTLGINQARLSENEIVPVVNRLAGAATEWRSIELNRKPMKYDEQKWKMAWNPYRQCSWPPEDEQIESFRSRVVERAKASLGADLARTEKFTTSMMDGLDIRETMRHWYDGELYVKIQPPTIGYLDACVFLFESQADPRSYPWRTTWFAEHEDESTLAFFATDFHQQMIGPGVAVATYGGALFLYPPRPIPDIWHNPKLDFADTMEDRIVAAACFHSQSRHIAFMSPSAPGAAWRRLAKRYGKRLVHVPLGHFNDAIVQQLRTVHVLNGQQVRSYASHFIRKA